MSNVSSSNSQGVRVPKLRFPGFEGEWERGSFSEIFSFLSNNTLSRAELSDVGEIKNIHYGDVLIKFGDIIDANNTNIPYVGSKVVLKKNPDYLQTGDVVIADTAEDDTVGKAAEILNTNNIPVISGLHTIPCRPNYPFVPSYLGYYLNSKSFHEQLYPFMQGIKVTSISKTNIGKTQISYPESIEQSKIAELLNLISDRIEKQQQLVEALKSYKRGALSKLFPKKGENTPEYRFRGFTEPWEQRKFSELYEKVSRKNDMSYGKEDIISVANMYYKADSNITDDSYLLTYNVFELGDIAFEGNKSKNFAHGRFVENTIGNGIVSHVFDVFKPIMPSYDLMFWKYAINDERLMGDILVRSTKASTMMTNLVANDFLQESFLVPSYEEQKKIGTFFRNLDLLITLHQRKLTEFDSVKAGLLQQLFI